jgi:hypothetical protein
VVNGESNDELYEEEINYYGNYDSDEFLQSLSLSSAGIIKLQC